MVGPPEGSGVGRARDDGEGRLNLARISYSEVLDATKHNDDKIGRALTSIAFLTTAGIAFAVEGNDKVLYFRYQMGDLQVPLPSIFLVAFLVLIVLTVILYLSAMGNPLTFPRHRDPKTQDSNLYFFIIAEQESEKWTQDWGHDEGGDYASLRRKTINNFLYEAHNIARRVKFKYERMEIARAVLITALLSFVMGVVASLIPFLGHLHSKSLFLIINWNLQSRLEFAIVIALIEFCLCFEAFTNARFKVGQGTVRLHLQILWLLPLVSVALLLIDAKSGASTSTGWYLLFATAAGVQIVNWMFDIYFFREKASRVKIFWVVNIDVSLLKALVAFCVLIVVGLLPMLFAINAPVAVTDIYLLLLAISPIFVTQFQSVAQALKDSRHVTGDPLAT
jgi:hypothetical protein